MTGTPRRPDPVHWLWYALGGRLPHRYREWVLFDATVRTWPLRHFARAFVQMSLVAVPVVLAVPGPVWIRWVGILLGCLVALQYALFTMEEAVEYRVRRAGYPGVRSASGTRPTPTRARRRRPATPSATGRSWRTPAG